MRISEDELLELVVAQFGDRVLPDEWNGVTEVEPPAGDSDQKSWAMVVRTGCFEWLVIQGILAQTAVQDIVSIASVELVITSTTF